MLKSIPKLTCQITYYKTIGANIDAFIHAKVGGCFYRIHAKVGVPCNYTT